MGTRAQGNIKGKPSMARDDSKAGNSADELIEATGRINSILPFISQTGYVLKEMHTEVSFPPGISLCFEKTLETSKQTTDKILKSHKDNEMLKMIVNALVAADEYRKKIKLDGMMFTGITVDVNMPPRVSIKFIKK